MKRLSVNINKDQSLWLFSSIRKKEDLIIILMKSIKLFLTQNKVPSINSSHTEVTIIISRMNRIFFSLPNKLITFNFPFQIDLTNPDSVRFTDKYLGEIDHKVTSDVISALNNKKCLDKECVFDFLQTIEESIGKEEFWLFFKNLLTFEDGYLRYDLDNSERTDPVFHPVNHIDIFYSSSNSFKIGLESGVNINKLIDILDYKTPCRFIASS